MFQTWQDWLIHSQQISFALMMVVLCLALLVLWNDTRRIKRMLDQIYGQSQKAQRELGQQRYALANLRESMLKHDSNPNEHDLFNDAMQQLDALLQALPAEAGGAEGKTLDQLKERDILAFLRKALRENKIALATQPVLDTRHEQVRFYEVFSRIKLGDQHIPAGKFLSIAKDHGMMAAIDQSLLLKMLELVQQNATSDFSISYFCNLSASSFANPKSMENIIKYLARQPRLSSRLIFELTQDDTFKLPASAKVTFEKLLELGCRFSMDNVKMLGLNIERLHDLRISFVKFDVNTVLKEIETSAGRTRWNRLKSLLSSQGLEVIIERVENQKQFDKLQDINFDYVQGYLLGKPEIVT